jgi:hypothetical protein
MSAFPPVQPEGTVLGAVTNVELYALQVGSLTESTGPLGP